MIKVEKKFFLRQEDIENLVATASFLGEETFTDAYMDTPDFLLTLHDKWLRVRNDKFQLQIPAEENGQYQELLSEDQIKRAVGIKSDDPLFTALKKHGFQVFCQMTTTRKKFRKNEFYLDLDQMDFGYHLGEIEIPVDYESQIPMALDKIKGFSQQYNLTLLPVRAKIFAYLKRHNMDHYQKLVSAGIVHQS